jgi:hypothetical protein
MRQTILIAILAVALELAGCSWPTPVPQMGTIGITITVSPSGSSAVTAQEIPSLAQYVRVRAYTTGVNALKTLALPPGGGTVQGEMRVPARKGYTVEAVSYALTSDGAQGVILTGARLTNVDVIAGQTTQANLVCGRWTATITTDKTEVESGAEYSVTAKLQGGGALTDSFIRKSSAFLIASLDNYQTPSSKLTSAVAAGDFVGNSVTLTAVAPDVSAPSTLYLMVRGMLLPEWSDEEGVPLFLEIPNRYLGELLHTITVIPAEGIINIGISGDQRREEP